MCGQMSQRAQQIQIFAGLSTTHPTFFSLSRNVEECKNKYPQNRELRRILLNIIRVVLLPFQILSEFCTHYHAKEMFNRLSIARDVLQTWPIPWELSMINRWQLKQLHFYEKPQVYAYLRRINQSFRAFGFFGRYYLQF